MASLAEVRIHSGKADYIGSEAGWDYWLYQGRVYRVSVEYIGAADFLTGMPQGARWEADLWHFREAHAELWAAYLGRGEV